MQLKRYQERVLREVKHFLERLAKKQAAKEKHPPLDAWEESKRELPLVDNYAERKNGLG
jgi:hypothetical protein